MQPRPKQPDDHCCAGSPGHGQRFISRTFLSGGALTALLLVFGSAAALADDWQQGDVITYGQATWGASPTPTNAANLLVTNYGAVYAGTSGVLEIGIPGSGGHSIVFTNGGAANTFLPASGFSAPLTSDLLNPTMTTSGEFGGFVTALQINVDFADAGVLLGSSGLRFGDLRLCNYDTLPLLNGLTVRQILAQARTLLGGGVASYGIAVIAPFVNTISLAFAGGQVSQFARDHLASGSCTSSLQDGDVISYDQDEWGSTPNPGNPASLLVTNFLAVYAGTSGVLEIGIPGTGGRSLVFTDGSSVILYLPASGLPAPLTADFVDPTTTMAGSFGGVMTALQINVDFADAGLLVGNSSTRFGDLRLCNYTTLPLLNGITVRQLLAQGRTLLGGGTASYNITAMAPVVSSVNVAFVGGYVSQYARNHLFLGACPVPAVWTWPTGPTPCNNANNLAACLNGVGDGAIVEIETSYIDGQTVTVSPAKSFTLRPAPAWAVPPPVFFPTTFNFSGGNAHVNIVIEGLGLVSDSVITVTQVGAGALDVTFRGNEVLGPGSALRIQADPPVPPLTPHGPVSFVIENNTFNVGNITAQPAPPISISNLRGAGNSGRITGNIIRQGGGHTAGIGIVNGSSTLNVDVIGNRIAGAPFGPYSAGVSLAQNGSGALTARVLNNHISGQVNGAGTPAGIALYVPVGSANFEVRNNTVANNQTGIRLSNNPANPGSTASTRIDNTIIAFNTLGISLEAFASTTTNAFNLVHGNGANVYTPGPGTLTGNPLFLPPDPLWPYAPHLRPRPGSPARDSGSNSLVPADLLTDIAGSTRIQGIVDRGAFEMSAGGVDTDGDGVANGLDNCTLLANDSQCDSDGDGYGNRCDGDLNNNSFTNSQDYILFRAQLGQSSAGPTWNQADLNCNGFVNSQDYILFRGRLGVPSGPSGLHP